LGDEEGAKKNDRTAGRISSQNTNKATDRDTASAKGKARVWQDRGEKKKGKQPAVAGKGKKWESASCGLTEVKFGGAAGRKEAQG